MFLFANLSSRKMKQKKACKIAGWFGL